MLQTVSIKELRPNPLQPRRELDPADIQQLADEIKERGYWNGGLRARQVDGHYELCFGHRRLEAFKLLKMKEVEIDVVPLSDKEMLTDALIENLQRTDLSDTDKAEAIGKLWEMETGEKLDHGLSSPIKRCPEAVEKIAHLLGYTASFVYRFLEVARMSGETRAALRKGGVGVRRATTAADVGGEKLARLSATKGIERPALEKMRKELAAAPEPLREKIRQKVVGKIERGEIKPDRAKFESGVRDTVRREVGKAKTSKKEKPAPPDLHDVLLKWTHFMKDWQKELQQVGPYREYIDSDPDVAWLFRKAVAALIEDLKKLL